MPRWRGSLDGSSDDRRRALVRGGIAAREAMDVAIPRRTGYHHYPVVAHPLRPIDLVSGGDFRIRFVVT